MLVTVTHINSVRKMDIHIHRFELAAQSIYTGVYNFADTDFHRVLSQFSSLYV